LCSVIPKEEVQAPKVINHLQSKRKIHVIHEGEDHKTIPSQEEI